MGVPAREIAPRIPAPGAASPSAKNGRTRCRMPAPRFPGPGEAARRRNAPPGTCAGGSLCSREVATDSLHPLAPPVAQAHLPPRAPPLGLSQARRAPRVPGAGLRKGRWSLGIQGPPSAAPGGVQVLGENRSAPPGDFSGGKQGRAQRHSGKRPGFQGSGRELPTSVRAYLSIRSTSARCSAASSVLSACSSLRMGGVS